METMTANVLDKTTGQTVAGGRVEPRRRSTELLGGAQNRAGRRRKRRPGRGEGLGGSRGSPRRDKAGQSRLLRGRRRAHARHAVACSAGLEEDDPAPGGLGRLGGLGGKELGRMARVFPFSISFPFIFLPICFFLRNKYIGNLVKCPINFIHTR